MHSFKVQHSDKSTHFRMYVLGDDNQVCWNWNKCALCRLGKSLATREVGGVLWWSSVPRLLADAFRESI